MKDWSPVVARKIFRILIKKSLKNLKKESMTDNIPDHTWRRAAEKIPMCQDGLRMTFNRSVLLRLNQYKPNQLELLFDALTNPLYGSGNLLCIQVIFKIYNEH